MISRGELKGRVLRLLNKTSQFRGFYADEKIDDSIQECLDFIATEMFFAGEGWQTKIELYDTQAGQLTIPVSPTIAMIKEVRYRYGNVYSVLSYDDNSGRGEVSNDSGERQLISRYRVVDNRLYFNPPLSEGGTEFLQIEYMAYPKQLSDDNDFIEGHFDQAMQHFAKYRTASILAASIEKFVVPWSNLESQWYSKMLNIANRRNLQVQPIRMFEP